MTKRIFTLLLAVLVLAGTGCHRRDLEDMVERINLRVDVNIKAVASVTTNVYNEHIPVPDLNTDMMRVMVYDPKSKNLLTQSFISNKSVSADGDQVLSGELNISYGDYDMLVYNFDTPTTQVTGENSENTILCYTDPLPASVRAHYLGSLRNQNSTKANTDDDPYADLAINYEPDHVLVAREENLHVSAHDTVVVIHTTAKTVVDTYYIQIHVEGMQFASSATALISGLAPSRLMGIGKPVIDKPSAICFDLVKSIDENIPGANKDVLCATFNTFGKIEDATSDLLVTFNVVDTGGNLQQKMINLDRIFKTEDAIERHWLLIDETWTIVDPGNNKPPSTGGGGFQPTVDDWQEEHGEIEI
ncbi:MAG: DUF5119 domain-containing protein [Bacteroidales bacterium]|nr:DUF5119 domain-containing protein [Bacteroidales bacterium]